MKKHRKVLKFDILRNLSLVLLDISILLLERFRELLELVKVVNEAARNRFSKMCDEGETIAGGTHFVSSSKSFRTWTSMLEAFPSC